MTVRGLRMMVGMGPRNDTARGAKRRRKERETKVREAWNDGEKAGAAEASLVR